MLLSLCLSLSLSLSLCRLASRAEAQVAWEASSEGEEVGDTLAERQAAVLKLFDCLVQEWRAQESAALDSCVVF